MSLLRKFILLIGVVVLAAAALAVAFYTLMIAMVIVVAGAILIGVLALYAKLTGRDGDDAS